MLEASETCWSFTCSCLCSWLDSCFCSSTSCCNLAAVAPASAAASPAALSLLDKRACRTAWASTPLCRLLLLCNGASYVNAAVHLLRADMAQQPAQGLRAIRNQSIESTGQRPANSAQASASKSFICCYITESRSDGSGVTLRCMNLMLLQLPPSQHDPIMMPARCMHGDVIRQDEAGSGVYVTQHHDLK